MRSRYEISLTNLPKAANIKCNILPYNEFRVIKVYLKNITKSQIDKQFSEKCTSIRHSQTMLTDKMISFSMGSLYICT